jgi:hypothetical protein
MMAEAYEAVREFVRQALLASHGDWNAAERLCHQRLAEDPGLRAQITQICVEWVIRNAITAEGRRQQQREADQLREAREAEAQAREIEQTVEEFLKGLRGKDGDDRPPTP